MLFRSFQFLPTQLLPEEAPNLANLYGLHSLEFNFA